MRTTRFDYRQQPRHQRGLTAVELLVTLAVLSVLIGLAAPSMTRFVNQWRVSNSINALTGTLRVARTEAIARARPVVVCRVASSTSTTCLSGAEANGFASGWIVFVDNNRDTNNDFTSASDEVLLRQEAQPGIDNIKATDAGRLVFLPNGLLKGDANSVNVDASGFVSASATPWARKGLCITKPGRVRSVPDVTSCADNEK